MGRPVDQARTETRLGSYEIVRKLARGGMAELFLASTRGPEGFAKLVVLKQILPKLAENPRFVRLFLDEAKLVSTLDHPHIARVFDTGKIDGNYFFTMEYVHGQDVRATLRRTARLGKTFPIDHAVQIARNIAAALHYAHERRGTDGALLDIVHRDVSPSNVLLSYDGAVKLVDFGVAKAATSSVKTRTGALKGKISYMSPEQAKGSPIDRRSDIFSLGIMLWEMVTTQRLFKGANDLATIQMIVNSKAPAPTTVRPDCPPQLEHIVMRALASDVEDRYQTAEQLQLDLEELAPDDALKRQTVSLRAYMQDVFAPEINAWNFAQASGQTLIDHVINVAPDVTAPVSQGELEFVDSEVDDDDDDDVDDESESEQATAAVVAGSMEAIEMFPPPLRPSGGNLLPRLAPDAPTMMISEQSPPPGPFPIAPREWMPRGGGQTEIRTATNERRTRKLIIAGSVAFAVIVLVVMLLAPSPNPPAKRVITEEPPTKVEMKATMSPPVEQP